MRVPIIVFVLISLLSACAGGTGKAPKPTTPYVALPLADLAPGTQMTVRGNHTGWWRNNQQIGKNAVNDKGQKLQRLDTTAVAGQYVAVFRNNVTLKYYGKGTFMMPASGATYNGVTDLGYKFSITRSNDALVYTLSGAFSMANRPIANSGRYAYGGFVAGSYTPATDLPTTGSATYTGSFIGYSSIAGLVTGNASINVNFAATSQQITGAITGLSGPGGTINDLTLRATIEKIAAGLPDAAFQRGSIVEATGTGTGAGAFPVGTTGPAEGGFYGPAAEEIGVTIRLVNNTNMLTGSIGGAQTLP